MLGDTIWAVATPTGSAPRGAIRISGPRALEAAARVCAVPVPAGRGAHDVELAVLGFSIPALVLVMPGPRSFTAEDVVELHLPGAQLLLERVGAALEPVARRALPGEFTRRAFENGRLSLDQAEAVLDLIHAADVDDLRRAGVALRGGLRAAVAQLRGRIDDVRAWIEAGLDFSDGETGEVDPDSWVPALDEVARDLAALGTELPRGAPAGDVVLLGAANAGKSSLCNALAGRDEMIVADVAGTTRDVLAIEIQPGVRLLDAPGDVDGGDAVDADAVRHRDALIAGAAAALLVVDPTRSPLRIPSPGPLPVLAVVLTHADLHRGAIPDGLPHGAPVHLVDSRHGDGIDALRRFLARHAATGPDGRGVRLAAAFGRARAAVLRAVGIAGEGGLELASAELADAVDALDEVDGRSSPEDLLDRIFGRFCLGK